MTMFQDDPLGDILDSLAELGHATAADLKEHTGRAVYLVEQVLTSAADELGLVERFGLDDQKRVIWGLPAATDYGQWRTTTGHARAWGVARRSAHSRLLKLASKGQAQRRPKTPARRGGHPTYWLIDEGHDAGPPWVRGVT